ncbi:hypothetical protein [Nonomuraea glycinis]|uniref:hypothetical protein n=1 Tax=Nonomuraea glycinis TaxID=2047744 RepID=UPI0033A6B058
MDLVRVETRNWLTEQDPGGWVVPHDDPFVWWTVTRVHALFVAPRLVVDEYDELLGRTVQRVRRPFELKARLVDLDGSQWELGDRERVLLHQRPGPRWWWLRDVSGEDLARMEQYRVG